MRKGTVHDCDAARYSRTVANVCLSCNRYSCNGGTDGCEAYKEALRSEMKRRGDKRAGKADAGTVREGAAVH